MKHVITNFNINDERVEQSLKNHFPEGLDFCYTDPPWGNLKYWATLNKKMNNVTNEVLNQNQLEDRFIDLITKFTKNYAFIVYGKREAESAINKLKQKPNVKDVQMYYKRYKSGSKFLENVVICVTLNDAMVQDWSDLGKQDGLAGLHTVCKRFTGKYTTCLELFVGVGYYLKVLDSYGYKVGGNELNKTRLHKALSKV
jgi:hypothetical protein